MLELPYQPLYPNENNHRKKLFALPELDTKSRRSPSPFFNRMEQIHPNPRDNPAINSTFPKNDNPRSPRLFSIQNARRHMPVLTTITGTSNTREALLYQQCEQQQRESQLDQYKLQCLRLLININRTHHELEVLQALWLSNGVPVTTAQLAAAMDTDTNTIMTTLTNLRLIAFYLSCPNFLPKFDEGKGGWVLPPVKPNA